LVEAWLQNVERIAVGQVRPDVGNLSATRLFDLALTSLLLVFGAPFMLLTAACIWLEDGGPVFFVQSRVGQNGVVFPCLKFRSMSLDADDRWAALLQSSPEARAEWALNRKLRKDPRVTFVGRFIRRRSLDELPQLFNVFVGHMSLVGPRPIMMDEVGLYGSRLRHYCSLRPGLTGLWQIMGRADASFRSRIAMDMIYIRSRRMTLDLWIIVVTIPAVVLGRGSY
jgi:lipopolysaccharide/colanic/teichoic acid biosynthesis glycosyltransferase